MIKLFCLPYAGGSSAIFSNWKKYISSNIDLCSIELSGRGRRFGEPLFTSMNDIVEDVYNELKDQVGPDQYAIFGHSMGSIIAYELCYKLEKEGIKKPLHIFFSGHGAPSIIDDKEFIYNLPNDKFIANVIELGATPEEIFKNKELSDIFLPIIRADFKAIETYKYEVKMAKLGVDISILHGKKEKIGYDELLEWRNHTNLACKFYMLDGGHFFIHDDLENVLKIINHTLIDS